MRASGFEYRVTPDGTELRSTVTSEVLGEPFELWFRVPTRLERYLDGANGDPLVPALLLPAMKLGERLEIPCPISARLAHATTRIQTIFRCWEPRLSFIEVCAPRCSRTREATEVGLFYSGGVDSSYSLIKNLIDHPLNEDVITQLVSIHGLDVRINAGTSATYERMRTDAVEIARRVGKGPVEVATNVQELMQRLHIPWGMLGHGSGLASVALLLQRMFHKIYVAPNGGSYAWLKPAGSHPLLDPLWSTEALTFVHDGSEATRLERIRLLVEHPVILDKLHVCWNQDPCEYNCGRCAKCLLVMIGLHAAGADGACATLPSRIDLDALRRVHLIIPAEVEWCAELLDALAPNPVDAELREALARVHARGSRHFDLLQRATRTLRRLIPGRQPFILVDEEAIREKLGVGIPFMERNGVFGGNPPDDRTAIQELERLRSRGARFMAFWHDQFWYLDHYASLNRHLDQRYRLIWHDDSLMVFDLGPNGRAATP